MISRTLAHPDPAPSKPSQAHSEIRGNKYHDSEVCYRGQSPTSGISEALPVTTGSGYNALGSTPVMRMADRAYGWRKHSWENRDIGGASAGTGCGEVNPNSDWKMLRTSLSQKAQRLFREQALVRTPACFQARLYATEVPWVRPPYRPAPSEQPPAETFSSPSKPRQYYARPVPKRDLPAVEVNLPPPSIPLPSVVQGVS